MQTRFSFQVRRTTGARGLCSTIALAASLLSPLAAADNLQQIFDLASANDPQIRAAEAQLKANQQLKNIGRSALLPQINAQAQYQENETSSEQGTNNSDTSAEIYGASLNQTLFNLPNWYTFKQGDSQARQAEMDYMLSKQDLVIRTSEAYFNVLRAIDNLATVSSEEKAFSSQLEQTQQRFEVGLIAVTDVHEAQASYDDVIARLLQARGNLGIAFESLSVLTGQSHLSIAPLSENYPILNPEPLDPNTWVETALTNNYSLESARLARDAAGYNLKSRRMEHLPSLDLNVTYSETKPDGSVGVFRVLEASDTTSIALTLNVPIYSGGRISSQRKQAYYQHVQSQEMLNNTQRTLIQNTRNLHLSVRTDVSTVNARKQAIKSAETALEATRAGYDVGTRNLVDVLNSERTLFQSKRDYFNARYNYIINLLNLERAAGILSGERISSINQYLDVSSEVARSTLEANASYSVNTTADQNNQTADTTTGTDNSDPEAAVRAWASAWQELRIKDYLAAYAENFNSRSEADMDAWAANKRSRLSRVSNPTVELESLQVVANDGERAVVRFTQRYSDDAYADVTEKELELVSSNGGWKIQAERALNVSFN